MKLFQDHYRHKILSLLKSKDIFLIDKMLDLINLGTTALVFGQFVGPTPLDAYALVFGISIVLLAYTFVWYTLNTPN